MTKFKRLLGDRIIVKPAEKITKTEGGIYMPDSAVEKPIQGEVIQVGQGIQAPHNGVLITPSVVAGEQVLYGRNAGTEIPIDGEIYLILRDSEIWGVL